MACGGLDIHSPFLFLSGAGIFLGAAVSAFLRSIFHRGKRRNVTVAGVYLYLALFFTVILFSLFLLDIPSLVYDSSFWIVGSVATALGAAAATWKKTAGGLLIVLIVSLFTLLTLYVGGRHCEEAEGPLVDVRVLSVSDERIELEIIRAVGLDTSRMVVENEGIAGGFSVIYSRVELSEWLFYPRASQLYRVEKIGPLSDNESGEGGPLIERVVVLLPFVRVSEEALNIAELEQFSRYRGWIDGPEVELEKVFGELEL